MATRNIVPRATGEGQIGTSSKKWSSVYANNISATNVTATFTGNLTGNVTGNADTATTATNATNATHATSATTATNATNATNDANGNNIATTYLPVVVGAVMAFAGSTSPTGWLLCDGSAVSRTDYAALFAVIGTTYGSGNGSTTFNLPNLIDKFVQGSATSGTVKSAGLPNIKGDLGFSVGNMALTGAFQFGSTKECPVLYAGEDSNYNPNIDASRSSAIYGNSSTVQPPALTMRYIIKY